jgi:peptidoglycan biosynthesis protein MviN/MurJ (putative lipid II flippase)
MLSLTYIPTVFILSKSVDKKINKGLFVLNTMLFLTYLSCSYLFSFYGSVLRSFERSCSLTYQSFIVNNFFEIFLIIFFLSNFAE